MSAPKSRVDTVPTRPPTAPVDSDLGSVHISVPPGTPAVEEAERRAAALTVTSNARTADEAREWLQMLGLLDTTRRGARATCPDCLRHMPITHRGVMSGHRAGWRDGAPVCTGKGKRPKEET